jgi:acyl-CoA thioester hydrolase
MIIKAKCKNIVPIQVRFSDVDVMGHVSNTVYQNYFDSGKTSYFEEVIPEMDFESIGIVGASIKIDYLKPIFRKTSILVETRITHLGNKSLTMEHYIIEENTNEVLSTCTAIMVCYKIKEQTSMPIPEEWRKKIIDFEEELITK